MNLIRYLKDVIPSVVLVFLLLAVQAFCDLSLPTYTSDIVDVGIQQAGVEDVACEQLSASTHDLVAMMLEEDDEALFEASYDLADDGTYVLNDAGRQAREQLDEAMCLPMVAVYYADQLGAELDVEGMLAAYEAGEIGKDEVLAGLEGLNEAADALGESLLEQQAIEAAKAEYEALGYDLDGLQMDYLLHTGAKMLLFAALCMVMSILVDLVASRAGARVAASLRERLFRRVLSFSDAEVQSFSAASLITRGTNDIQLIQMVLIMFMRMVLYAPILAVGGIVMVARTNISMSWVIVLAVALIFLLLGVLMSVAMPKFRIVQKLIDRVNLVAREILNGLPVIRAFGRQSHEQERFDDANTRLMKTQLFTNRVMAVMMPAMQLIMNGTSVLIVWVGASYVDVGAIQTGDLIAFITYSMVVIMGFLMLGMISVMLPRADVAAERVNEVLETTTSIRDPEPDKSADARLRAGTGGARIAFEDVGFSYGDSQERALDHISFEALPGTTTAIIGSTGSGKSTLLKLVERFYDVTEGAVTIDGIDVRDVSQQALREQLGYVPQQAFLFSGTIDSNIAYSDLDMPARRVDEAAEIAQASDFIASREQGLATPISQGGTNVSGGQRQRLAIARALACDARAYLFDDSFSALDYKTDAALRRELDARLADRTVIIVAQRIATVMGADTIVVLDEGRIVGKGTHAQLLESCPEYREIAVSQLSEEELAGGVAS